MQNIFTILTASLLASLTVTGLLFVVDVAMADHGDMQENMTGCMFAHEGSELCAMDTAAILSVLHELGGAVSSLGGQLTLLFGIAAASVVFASLFNLRQVLWRSMVPMRRVVERRATLPRNNLALAFSSGILHSKAY